MSSLSIASASSEATASPPTSAVTSSSSSPQPCSPTDAPQPSPPPITAPTPPPASSTVTPTTTTSTSAPITTAITTTTPATFASAQTLHPHHASPPHREHPHHHHQHSHNFSHNHNHHKEHARVEVCSRHYKKRQAEFLVRCPETGQLICRDTDQCKLSNKELKALERIRGRGANNNNGGVVMDVTSDMDDEDDDEEEDPNGVDPTAQYQPHYPLHQQPSPASSYPYGADDHHDLPFTSSETDMMSAGAARVVPPVAVIKSTSSTPRTRASASSGAAGKGGGGGGSGSARASKGGEIPTISASSSSSPLPISGSGSFGDLNSTLVERVGVLEDELLVTKKKLERTRDEMNRVQRNEKALEAKVRSLCNELAFMRQEQLHIDLSWRMPSAGDVYPGGATSVGVPPAATLPFASPTSGARHVMIAGMPLPDPATLMNTFIATHGTPRELDSFRSPSGPVDSSRSTVSYTETNTARSSAATLQYTPHDHSAARSPARMDSARSASHPYDSARGSTSQYLDSARSTSQFNLDSARSSQPMDSARSGGGGGGLAASVAIPPPFPPPPIYDLPSMPPIPPPIPPPGMPMMPMPPPPVPPSGLAPPGSVGLMPPPPPPPFVFQPPPQPPFQ